MADDLDKELLDLLQPTASPSRKSKASPGGKKRKATASSAKKAARKRKSRGSDSTDESEAITTDADSDESDFSSAYGASDDEVESSDDESDAALDELEMDEQELAGLTEFQREALIAEREEKRQQLLERREIKKRLKQSARSSNAPKKDRKLRDSKAKAQKAKKLQELKAKRSGKKSKLDYEEKDVDIGDSDDDGEAYLRRIRSSYAANDDSTAENKAITLEELCSIQITRDQLEKWIYAPFLEQVAVGLFVRLGVGINSQKVAQYRVAEIVGVEEYHRVYKLNSTMAKVALRLRHGKAEKVFLMDILSNAPFTEDEYARWVKIMKAEKQRSISKNLVKARHDAFQEALQRAYTEEEVSVMVRKRQEAYAVPTNLSLRKVKLQADLDEAEALGDTETVTRLSQEIESIAYQIEHPDGELDKKVDVWAQLNQRNRLQNLKDVSQAEQISRQQRIGQITEKSRTKKSAAGAAAKFDPFARIKAMPTQIDVDQEIGERESGESTPMDGRRRSTVISLTSPLETFTPKLDFKLGEDQTRDAFDLLADADIDIDI